MALSSLSDLKATVKKYRGRSDTEFNDLLDTFVTMFESRANAELEIRVAEVDTTLTGTTDSRSISLPSDFLEPIALFLTTYGVEEHLAPIIAGNYALETSSGVPEAWMINGSNLDLDKPCDQAHTFRFRYRMKKLDLATTDPNWLLTNHPDVYLYGVLREAAIFAGDDGAAAGYEVLYTQAKDRVKWLEARSKAIAPLRVDAGLVAVTGFNINTGDYSGLD